MIPMLLAVRWQTVLTRSLADFDGWLSCRIEAEREAEELPGGWRWSLESSNTGDLSEGCADSAEEAKIRVSGPLGAAMQWHETRLGEYDDLRLEVVEQKGKFAWFIYSMAGGKRGKDLAQGEAEGFRDGESAAEEALSMLIIAEIRGAA